MSRQTPNRFRPSLVAFEERLNLSNTPMLFQALVLNEQVASKHADFVWSPIVKPAAAPDRARLDGVVILDASLPSLFTPLPRPIRLLETRATDVVNDSQIRKGHQFAEIFVTKKTDTPPQSPTDANETITIHGTRTELPAGHAKYGNIVLNRW